MARRRVRLTYTPSSVTEPVIHELGTRFAVVTNIRRADVTRTDGWALIEVDGELDEIDRGLSWVAEQGVRVDPVEGDLAT